MLLLILLEVGVATALLALLRIGPWAGVVIGALVLLAAGIVAALVTARKLKCARWMSPNTRACRSLSSGRCERMPPLSVVQRVSFTSPTLALLRASEK